jgi:endonuclease YncB( thermonuclease family)
MHRAPVLLMLLLLSSTAFANDFVGQASVIDGDTLEIHGTRIRLWGVDAPRAVSYAEVRIATCIVVARMQRTR